MRIGVLIVVILGVGLYAFRDWFIAVCLLVMMDALMKYGDMPRSLFDIQGLNLWNLLLVFAILGWLKERLRTGLRREVPVWVMLVTFGYVMVMVVAFLRGAMDVSSVRTEEDTTGLSTAMGFTSDYLINPFKYFVVAYLLFDGARTRRNMLLGLGAVFAQAGLYALRVVRYIPPSVLLMSENPFRDKIQRECGLQANDMALVMVIAFWGLMSSLGLWRQVRWWWRVAAVGGALVTAVALGLTLSRAGYMAFAGLGLLLGIVRWRRLLIALPVVGLLVCLAFPSIPARLTEGFGVTSVSGKEVRDMDAISGGRVTNLWPPTIEQISKSPVIGYGRLAILRTSPLYELILAGEGMVPTHPHNAYLEMLLDSGAVGLGITLTFFVGLPILALRRSRSDDPLVKAALGTGLAAAGAILIMGTSGQSFFPREGVFMVFCAYGLMMRGYVVGASQPIRLRRVPRFRRVGPPQRLYGVAGVHRRGIAQ